MEIIATIVKNITRYAFVFILSFFLHSTAYADINCSKAFNGDGKLIESGVLCPHDVSSLSLQQFVGNVYYKSPSLNQLFTSITGYAPADLGALQSSNPIAAALATSLNISILLAALLVIWRIFSIGYQITTGQKELDASVLDLKNLSIATIAILLIGNDGVVSFFQMIILTLPLLGMVFAAWLQSLALPAMFKMEITNNTSEADYLHFKSDGEIFASRLVGGLSVAQASADYANYINVETTEAVMFEEDMGVLDHILGYFKSGEDATFAQVLDGKFYDTSYIFNMQSPLFNHGGVRESAKSTLEIASGRTKNDEIITPKFLTNYKTTELYDGTVALNISSVVPELKREVYVSIANHSRLTDLITALLEAAKENKSPTHAKQAMLSIIRDISGKYEVSSVDVINALQAFAAGAFSVKATKDGIALAEYKSTPFDLSEELSGIEPFSVVLKAANDVLVNYRSEKCLKNLTEAAFELGSIYELRKNGGDTSVKFKSLSNEPFVNTICTYPSSKRGGYELAMSEELELQVFSAIEAVYEGKVENITVSQALTEIQRKFIFDSANEISELSKIHKKTFSKYEVLVRYYSMLSSVSRSASLEYLGETTKDKVDAAIKETRMRGAGVSATAFSAFSKRTSEVDNAVFQSLPVVNVEARVDGSSGLLPRRVIEELDEIRQKKYVASMKDFSVLMTGGSERENLSDQTTDKSDVDEIARKLGDMLTPNDSMLKQGFGFDKNNTLVESLSDCATTKTCVTFNGHPIALIIRYNEALFSQAVMTVVIAGFVKSLKDLLSLDFLEDSQKDGGLGDSKAANWLTKIGINIAKGGTILLKGLLAVADGIASVFGTLGYAVMAIALAGSVVLKLMLALDTALQIINLGVLVLMLSLVMPILIVFTFVTDGRSAISSRPLINKFIELALKPILFYVGFWAMYWLSYPVFFAINAVVGSMFSTIEDVGGATEAVFAMIIGLMIAIAAMTWGCHICIKIMRELETSVLSLLQISTSSKDDSANAAEKVFVAATLVGTAQQAINNIKQSSARKKYEKEQNTNTEQNTMQLRDEQSVPDQVDKQSVETEKNTVKNEQKKSHVGDKKEKNKEENHEDSVAPEIQLLDIDSRD